MAAIIKGFSKVKCNSSLWQEEVAFWRDPSLELLHEMMTNEASHALPLSEKTFAKTFVLKNATFLSTKKPFIYMVCQFVWFAQHCGWCSHRPYLELLLHSCSVVFIVKEERAEQRAWTGCRHMMQDILRHRPRLGKVMVNKGKHLSHWPSTEV